MDAPLNGIMVRSDARAIGMVTAFRTGGTRRSPRTTARELTSECVSYFADNPTVKIPFGPTRTRNGNRKRYDVVSRTRITAASLAPIGDSNH